MVDLVQCLLYVFYKSPSGKDVLFSGCSNGQVTTWCMETYRVLSSWNAHNGKGVTWLGTYENILFSQGRDGKIHQWQNDQSNWTECGERPCPIVNYCPCSLTPSGKLVIPGENELHLTSIKSSVITNEQTLSHPFERCGMCMSLKIFENSSTSMVIAGYENGTILTWDCRKCNEPIFIQHNVHKEPIMCLDFDNNSSRGISGSADDELCTWTLKEDFNLSEKIQITNPGVSSVRIRNDSRILSVGGWDNRIRIFNWKNLKPLAVLTWHCESIHCLEFTSNPIKEIGLVLAAGSKDEKISLWDLYNKKNK